MTSLNLHWRVLTASVAAILIAAFVVPPWLPAPDLKENRTLASAPAWPTHPGDFDRFRAGVDTYVADRFPARAHLIAAFNYARLPFQVTGSSRVIVGRSGWLFYDDGSHLGSARGDPALTAGETRAWLTALAGRTEALRAHGTPYLVVTAPLKETVYPQYGPAWYAGPSDERAGLRLATLAKRSGAGDVLHLYSAVETATHSGVKTFSPHDTHWTGAGAYMAYVAIMHELQRLEVGEPPRPMADFPPTTASAYRDLAQMLGVAGLVNLDYVALGDPLAEQQHVTTYLTSKRDWTGARVIKTGEVGKPTVLITVDSFSNALLPFLYSHFSTLIIAHNQDGAWREDLIKRFDPDLVILEVVESGLKFSMDVAPAASPAAVAKINSLDLGGPPSKVLVQGAIKSVDSDARLLKALASAEPAKGCNPEAVALRPMSEKGVRLEVSGWISNLGRRPAFSEGVLRLSGLGAEYLAPIQVDKPRPDVAAHFSKPAARLSGFVEDLAADAVPPGRYRLFLYRRAPAGWIYCAGGQELVVP
ncbi:MAG: hypothetical protein Q8Q88_19585 [Phenylobacterium sp.]|uniref:alginate O-acetyltransferase AlgX-related protein n=1 Tax=Phenylobacterium sp. TaxID=1871053 RepID=UPI00273464F1|nr:hypothetical protein [Phenylobacterium sp.]MDP3749244.1 hypothetical protein [Phenylobacterium sp.]